MSLQGKAGQPPSPAGCVSRQRSLGSAALAILTETIKTGEGRGRGTERGGRERNRSKCVRVVTWFLCEADAPSEPFVLGHFDQRG